MLEGVGFRGTLSTGRNVTDGVGDVNDITLTSLE